MMLGVGVREGGGGGGGGGGEDDWVCDGMVTRCVEWGVRSKDRIFKKILYIYIYI